MVVKVSNKWTWTGSRAQFMEFKMQVISKCVSLLKLFYNYRLLENQVLQIIIKINLTDKRPLLPVEYNNEETATCFKTLPDTTLRRCKCVKGTTVQKWYQYKAHTLSGAKIHFREENPRIQGTANVQGPKSKQILPFFDYFSRVTYDKTANTFATLLRHQCTSNSDIQFFSFLFIFLNNILLPFF